LLLLKNPERLVLDLQDVNSEACCLGRRQSRAERPNRPDTRRLLQPGVVRLVLDLKTESPQAPCSSL
jgi:hypothetical protein